MTTPPQPPEPWNDPTGAPPPSGGTPPPGDGQGQPPEPPASDYPSYPPPRDPSYPPPGDQSYPPSGGDQSYPPPGGQSYPAPGGQSYPPPGSYPAPGNQPPGGFGPGGFGQQGAPHGGPSGGFDTPTQRSVIALVLAGVGLVCCGCFTGIPAVVLGFMELKDKPTGKTKLFSQIAIGVGVLAILWGIFNLVVDPFDLR